MSRNLKYRNKLGFQPILPNDLFNDSPSQSIMRGTPVQKPDLVSRNSSNYRISDITQNSLFNPDRTRDSQKSVSSNIFNQFNNGLQNQLNSQNHYQREQSKKQSGFSKSQQHIDQKVPLSLLDDLSQVMGIESQKIRNSNQKVSQSKSDLDLNQFLRPSNNSRNTQYRSSMIQDDENFVQNHENQYLIESDYKKSNRVSDNRYRQQYESEFYLPKNNSPSQNYTQQNDVVKTHLLQQNNLLMGLFQKIQKQHQQQIKEYNRREAERAVDEYRKQIEQRDRKEKEEMILRSIQKQKKKEKSIQNLPRPDELPFFQNKNLIFPQTENNRPIQSNFRYINHIIPQYDVLPFLNNNQRSFNSRTFQNNFDSLPNDYLDETNPYRNYH